MGLQGPKRQEIRVPSPVLVHANQPFRPSADIDELLGFCGGGDEGLFDEDVFSGVEGRGAEGEVGVGGSGDDYEVYFVICEHFFRGMVDLGIWVVFRGRVRRCRRALHDGVEGHGGGGEDEGDVEDFRGHARGCQCFVLLQLFLFRVSCKLAIDDAEWKGGHTHSL